MTSWSYKYSVINILFILYSLFNHKEINLDDNLDLNDTYNYEITVKDENNKDLFKAKSSSKIIIK